MVGSKRSGCSRKAMTEDGVVVVVAVSIERLTL